MEKYKKYMCQTDDGYVFKFPNGYGASVIKNGFSYGGKDGLWEVATIKFNKCNKFDFDFDIIDIEGYLTEEEVERILERIKRQNDVIN